MKYEKRNYDTYNFIRRYLHEDALRNFLIESKLAKHALPKKNTIIRVYESTTKIIMVQSNRAFKSVGIRSLTSVLSWFSCKHLLIVNTTADQTKDTECVRKCNDIPTYLHPNRDKHATIISKPTHKRD